MLVMLLQLLLIGAVPQAASQSAAQCCTCLSNEGSRPFQIPQSSGCSIACSTSGGKSVGVRKCTFGGPQPDLKPIPDYQCGAYWQQIGGDCKGNKWIQCDLRIKQETAIAIAGDDTTFRFTNDNLGQEIGPRDIGMRHRIALQGTIIWGDGTPNSSLDTGDFQKSHKYAKPGKYLVTAEIHGDFKWNNANEGASCSYRDRTAPASILVKVNPSDTEHSKQ